MAQRSLTRRDFLRALVPAWLTMRVVKAALIGITVLFVLSAAVSDARSERFWTNLRGLGIFCGAGVALWLVARLVAVLKARSRNFPPALAALLAVLGQLIDFVAAAAAGAYLYARWKNGDDLLGVAISFGVFAIVHLRGEWERRAKNSRRDFDSEGTPH